VLEAMNKDTLSLAGTGVGRLCEECPLDKMVHLCTQTENGLSARSFETILRFSKTLAWFRGHDEVSWEDVAQIIPWTIRDKLTIHRESPFFAANPQLLQDKTAWIENMLEMNERNWKDHQPTRRAVGDLALKAEEVKKSVVIDPKTGRPGERHVYSIHEVRERAGAVFKMLERFVSQDFSGWVYEDVLECKRLYQGYQTLLTKRKAGKE
jgi:hypothetical protein